MRAALVLVVGIFLAWPSTASATLFRRPFDTGHALGTGFDNDGGAGGCLDYECGGYCYNGHGGSDYPMPVGTAIVAGADGNVVTAVNGCATYGFLGNSCGDFCGNYVKIEHDDGVVSLYCHMELDSIRVTVGQRVSCGTHLGNSASSGSSTGPHLHFGARADGRTNTDPYRGSCSGSRSLWVNQREYTVLPGTECERSCECEPSASQTRDCGRCGSQSRTCGGDCLWGGWGGCGGEGTCSVGATESEACCDCGSRTRSCSGGCSWGEWSGCAGPDPEPKDCSTGAVGVCSSGLERCVEGCITCVQAVEPTPELCDGLDNNCNGSVDDGAAELGADQVPNFAAEIADYGFPQTIRAGQRSPAWILVRNAGSQPWSPGEIWLGTIAAERARPSPLQDRDSWPAWDVAAVLDSAVNPGESSLIEFFIATSELGGTLYETFRLTDPTGAPIACPTPAVTVAVQANGTLDVSDRVPTQIPRPEDAAEDTPSERQDGDAYGASRTGCAVARNGRIPHALVMILLSLFWVPNRRLCE